MIKRGSLGNNFVKYHDFEINTKKCEALITILDVLYASAKKKMCET